MSVGQSVERLVWLIALVCAVLAGALLWLAMTTAAGAPQEAAGAALALGVAVIPYVGARTVQELRR